CQLSLSDQSNGIKRADDKHDEQHESDATTVNPQIHVATVTSHNILDESGSLASAQCIGAEKPKGVEPPTEPRSFSNLAPEKIPNVRAPGQRWVSIEGEGNLIHQFAVKH